MRRTKYWVRRFNLIEIVLAMGVVGIGIAGVMSLMAPALNANRDSMAEAVAAEAAGKVMGFLEMQHKTAALLHPADTDEDKSAWGTCMDSYRSSFTVSGSGSSAVYTLVAPANKTAGSSPEQIFNNGSQSIALQHMNSVSVGGTADSGFFQVLDSGNEAVADVRLFKAVQILGLKTGSSLNLTADVTNVQPNAGLVRYLIEVSWPTNTEYTSPSRQFRYFAYEVVKQ